MTAVHLEYRSRWTVQDLEQIPGTRQPWPLTVDVPELGRIGPKR